MSLRAIDVFLTYLKAERATTIFGIPGGLLHPFFAAVEADRDFRLIVTKHEEGAAFMADGYARVGRRLAVCAGNGGPGSTNLLTGVGCAFADGVPLLVVTGGVARDSQGKGAAQDTNREDIDIVEMFRPVTKYSAMVASPGSLAHHLRRALRQALTGRPGPVHLSVPIDIWQKPVTEDWFRPETYRPNTRIFDRAEVHKAASTLLDASKPVFLAGGGVHVANAEEHLRALAELLPARVATTARAKGIFPEDHALSLGVLGFAGHRDARETVFGQDVDVLLTVGASLNEATTLNWHPALAPSRAFIQLDIDADRIGRNYPVDVPLVGDAQTILVELVYHVHRLLREGRHSSSRWADSEPLHRDHRRYNRPESRTSSATPLTPERWRVDLQETLPTNAVIFSDIGGHMFTNVHDLCVTKGQQFVINFGFASMGHGTCAPVGAALADPDRPVVAIVGDACFTMNGMELLTAAEYDVPVVWIVENNQMHGVTYHGSVVVGGVPLESVRYKKPLEVAAIARAMGIRAWVVDAPGKMTEAVRQAFASREPALIEVRVDASIPPPLDDRALAIAGFIEQ